MCTKDMVALLAPLVPVAVELIKLGKVVLTRPIIMRLSRRRTERNEVLVPVATRQKHKRHPMKQPRQATRRSRSGRKPNQQA